MLNFKKSLLVSLVGHLAVWGIFSFSFGEPGMKPFSSPLYFWGQLLRDTDTKGTFSPVLGPPLLQIKNPEKTNLLLKKPVLVPESAHAHYIKPHAGITFGGRKEEFNPAAAIGSFVLEKKESMIMLHPLLPEYFMLLFKDRQVVNIVLEFKINDANARSYTILKRKISSGNLEADLLTMRYISHYLFVQADKFPRNTWQSIAIELSTLNNTND